MATLYSDDNGARVLIRHKGPAGKGFPAGGTTGQLLAKTSGTDYDATWVNPPDGTDAVVGPASAVNGNFALFDGITGKLIKDSTFAVSHFATKSYADTKVDIVAGKGLSTEDFTTALRDKLTLLSPAGYRGTYSTLEALEAATLSPLQQAGDYALIEVAASLVQLALWDATNGVWSIIVPEPLALEGSAIAAELFDTDDVWSQDTCRIFTETEKAQLAAHEALIQALTGSGTSTANAYVAVSANYIILKDNKTVNCVANSFVLTLPTAVGQTTDITVKNSGGGTITINTIDGIQTIDGDVSVETTTQWESLTFRSTGTNWLLV